MNTPNLFVKFDVDTSKHSKLWKFVLAYSSISLLVILLSLNTPLTFDEAFNWNFYSNFSLAGIVTDYSVSWNNQVPFTLMQQMIPNELLSLSPWYIRIISTFTGLLLLLSVMRQSWLRNADVRIPFLLVTGSPMIISYLFIARSYSFTALLLTSAFVLSSRQDEPGSRSSVYSVVAAVFLAASIWAIPTNIFLAPVWFLFQLLRRKRSLFLIQGFVFVSLVILFFAPSFIKMFKLARNNTWSGSPSFISYANEFSFLWFSSFMAIILMVVCNKSQVLKSLTSLKSRSSIQTLNRFDFLALSATFSSLSYFLFISLAYLAGMGWPFARNATAPIWIFILGIAVLPISFSFRSKFILYLLCLTSLLGVFSTASNFSGENLQRMNPVLYETVPVGIRDLKNQGVTRVVCSGFDGPVCILSIGFLMEQNISMQLSDGLVPNLACVIGKTKPPKQWQVRLFKGENLWGQLCH
jgi:hypothetical protein